jgi:methoxymalonate biosynthesis acyl carrier protein
MKSSVNPVAAQLEQFVRSKFEIAADDPDFTSDVHLFDYGYVDSFGAQELIHHVESTYKIKIADDDFIKYPLNTVNEISRFIIDRQAGTR